MSGSGQFPPQNSPDWLPSGWTVEIRSNNGKNVKSYVDQLTGYRFYSKPKVLEYLGTLRNYSWTSQAETAGNDYDINLPVNLNQTPGLLPHRSVPETTPLETFSQGRKINEPVVLEPLYSSEVEAEKSPDWLPPGWTEEVKVRDGRMVKTYIDPLWGHRFYTKPQVLQYLGVVTNDSSTSQKETSGNTSESNLLEKATVTPEPLPYVSTFTTPWENGSQSKLLEKATGTPEPLPHVSTLTTPWENGSQSKRRDVPSELKFPELQASEMSYSGRMVTEKPLDWLPSGWTVEVNVRNGRSYKIYVDPLTGRKFYSKPKVLEYLGAAINGSGTSERKKTGNDFDINLPVNINDPLEPLPHGQFMGLETQENGSQSGKSFELDVGNTGGVTPASPLVQSQNMNTLDNTMYPKETNSRKRPGRKTDVDKIEGVISTPKLVECQNMNTLDNTIHPKETSSKKRAGRKVYFSPDVNKTEDVTSIPQLVESQVMNTLDNIHRKETSFRKRPGRKANVVESQIMNTLDNIHLKETSSRKRPGRKANVVTTGEETLPPQLVECQNGKSLDPSGYTSTSKGTSSKKKPGKRPTVDKTEGETPSPRLVESPSVITPSYEASSSKQPEGKIGMEQLPKGLPPGWITEIKTKRIRSNKFKKISYYIDPVSGFVFSSQKDAWRYYEAGDVSKCVIKPKNREEMGFTTEKSLLNVDKDGNTSPLQLLVEPKHVNTQKETRISPEDEKLRSSKRCDGEVLIERVTAEGLPSGWIKEVKTEKFYTDPGSGYVFMSQKDALLFLETGDIGACAVKPKSREELGLNEASTPMTSKVRGGLPVQQLEQSQIDNTPRLTRASRQNQVSSSKKIGDKIAVEGVAPDETPRVTVDENSIQKATGMNKTRGESDMQQIKQSQALNTPKMGKSKTRGKSALQHLEQSPAISTPDHASSSSPQKKVTSTMHNGNKFVLERVAPTGLPPGWIKEIRIQKKAVGIRKDPFFTDPISGYVFSSLKDVYRFVETGGIHSCAMKPKKREELGFNQLSDIASPAVVQKPERDSTKKQLSPSKVGSKRSLDTTDSDVSQKRRQTRSSIASPAVIESPGPDATKQLTTSRVKSKKGLATIGSDGSQKRQTRSAIASPADVQTPEANATNKQLTTGRVNSGKGLATIASDVSQKRQTRSAIASAAVRPDLEHGTTNLSSGTKIGSKRSSETVYSDVSQKRQTRSAASPAVLHKQGHDTTEKQLSTGKKVCSKRNLETTDSNVSQKRRQTRSSATAVTGDTPTAELPKEAPKLDIVFEKPTKAKMGNASNKSPLPRTAVSKREKGGICSPPETETSKVKNVRSPPSTVNVKLKNVKVKGVRSPPSTKNLRVKKGTEKNSNKNADTPASRSKKETKENIRTPPSRTSKRISGINIETVPDAGPIDKALTSKVKKSGKNKVISLTAPDNLPSGEQPPTAEVQSSKEDNGTQMNVEYSEQTLTSEGENSGKTDNVPCPNAPDDVADNTPQQLETVSEIGDAELEKSCQNKDTSCPNTSVVDVVHDAPEEHETGPVMGKIDHDLGGTDPPLNAEVSNKSNEATEDQAKEQIVPQEQLSEVSNKSNEAVGDQIVSQQKPTEVSSNRNEAAEDQVEEKMVLQKKTTEVSNKSSKTAEDQAQDQTVSQENHAEVSNKSNEAAEDRAQDQTVSHEQSTEVSNKSVSIDDKAEDQMVSQELSAEVSNIYVSIKNQTISQEPPAVSNQSWEVVEEEAEDQTVSQEPAEVPNQQECINDQTISQEPPTEVSKTEAMEEKVEERTMSQDQPMYQFGEETWSDPCLDFAFKTLTGTLPFEDNVQEPNMFQAQGDNSQAKITDNGLAMLDFGATSAHQVSNSHAQNASEAFRQMDNSDTQPESETQYPTNPFYLPDMNSSLPSGSEIAPQQTDFEENKNDDKDKLTLDNYARFLF